MSSWQNSNRRDRLPPGWDRIRKRILKRDGGVCQADLDGELCGDPANQVDHIRAGDNHHESNLESLCEWHHGKKSSREGNDARRRKRAEINSRFRQTEDHPGLL